MSSMSSMSSISSMNLSSSSEFSLAEEEFFMKKEEEEEEVQKTTCYVKLERLNITPTDKGHRGRIKVSRDSNSKITPDKTKKSNESNPDKGKGKGKSSAKVKAKNSQGNAKVSEGKAKKKVSEGQAKNSEGKAKNSQEALKKSKVPKINIVPGQSKYHPVPNYEEWMKSQDLANKWVRKPRLLKQDEKTMTLAARKFKHMLLNEDRRTDMQLAHNFDALTPVQRQTGILTHVPAMGAPIKPDPEPGISGIRAQMEGLIKHLKDNPHELPFQLPSCSPAHQQSSKQPDMPNLDIVLPASAMTPPRLRKLQLDKKKKKKKEQKVSNSSPSSSTPPKLQKLQAAQKKRQKVSNSSTSSSGSSCRPMTSTPLSVSRLSLKEPECQKPRVEEGVSKFIQDLDAIQKSSSSSRKKKWKKTPLKVVQEEHSDSTILSDIHVDVGKDLELTSDDDGQRTLKQEEQVPVVKKRKIGLSDYIKKKTVEEENKEEGELEDSDEDISIVNIKKLVAKKVGSSSSWSSSGDQVLTIDEKIHHHKSARDDTVYTEPSPFPPTAKPCQDAMIVEKVLDEQAKDSQVNGQNDKLVKKRRVEGKQVEVEQVLEEQVSEEQANADQSDLEDCIDLNIGQEDLLELSVNETEEDTTGGDAEDVPNQDGMEEVQNNTGQVSEQSGEEEEEEDDGVPSVPPELQRDIFGLQQRQICYNACEYGACDNSNCPWSHHLNPADIFQFYRVIRNCFEEQLPAPLRVQQRRDLRLMCIYQSTKMGLITRNSDGTSTHHCSLLLLNMVLEDIDTLEPHRREYVLLCKTIVHDLCSWYPKDQFVTEYLANIKKIEVDDIVKALAKLAVRAQAVADVHPHEADDIADQVHCVASERGLVLDNDALEAILSCVESNGDLTKISQFTNYLAQLPGHDLNVNRLKALIEAITSENKFLLCLTVLMPTLMSLDATQVPLLTTPLLQGLVNSCQKAGQAEATGLFIDRLRSYNVANLFILPKEPAFVDTALENQLMNLIENRKWHQLAEKFTTIPLANMTDLQSFFLKLFDVASENEATLSNLIFHLVPEAWQVNGRKFLPIQKRFLQQLAASIVFHFVASGSPSEAEKTLLTCRQFGLEPWKTSTQFNPDAMSNAVQTRHAEDKILMACIDVWLASKDSQQKAVLLLQNHETSLVKMWTKEETYKVARNILIALLGIKYMDDIKRVDQCVHLFNTFLVSLSDSDPFMSGVLLEEIRCNFFNDTLHQLLLTSRIDGRLLTHTLPFVKRHQIICCLSHVSIRGVVTLLLQKDSLYGPEFYDLGVQLGAYQAQQIDHLEADIALLTTLSPYEMQAIFNDCFNKMVEVITRDEIRRMTRAADEATTLEETELTGIHKVAFGVRIELPESAQGQTGLPFLDHLAVSSVARATQRVDQVLSGLSPKVYLKKVPGLKNQTRHILEPRSLLKYLYSEVLGYD